MKRTTLILLLATLVAKQNVAQSSATTLDIVGWNIEWFGSSSNGPSNDDLQEANVKALMSWMNADLYGLVEIVDTMRLRRVVDHLGNTEFGFVIAPYCSGNTSGTGNGWLLGQKQAFIYRKSVFTNVTTRGLMRNSSTAYTNWAAGRFPYMLSATATINGVSRNLNFILLHGKAGDTQDDYLKRASGAIELKDTLDAFFSNAGNLIIGDFNDALHTSIYLGASVSSYYSIVSDSTDSDHYKSITLPLGVAGQSSMINFPNVIDNHVISNEVTPYYIPGSARIKTDVTTVVPDYVSAHNTSDHYPVFSNYNLSGVVTGLPIVNPSEFGFVLFPNPTTGTIYLKATRTQRNITLRLMSADGKLLSIETINTIYAGMIMKPSIPELSRGLYFLEILSGQARTSIRLVSL